MSLLAETLREWDERNFNEGRQEGLLEGERKGLLDGLLEGQRKAWRRSGPCCATKPL